MKAIVFVDGYNLYYSRLRHSQYKWLDLVKLFEAILRAQDPSIDQVHVRYFTAPAIARYARHGQTAIKSQSNYHRALEALYPEQMAITLGRHHLTSGWLPQAIDGVAIDHAIRHRVWQVEEKLTDVNIALDFYRCAVRCEANTLIVCSNDSDMGPAMRLVRDDYPDQRLGLVAPLPEPVNRAARPVAASLATLAHWTRHYLRDEELAAAQLPNTIPTGKKPIRKPDYW